MRFMLSTRILQRWSQWRSSRSPRSTVAAGAFSHAFSLRHLDGGSCNACELELHALSAPQYDSARFGIDFVASPRHADALVLTGAVTHNLAEAVRMTVAATPLPRMVIACGDCARGRGPFSGSYAVVGSPADAVAVDLEIPGCPPSPQVVLDALCEAANRVSQ
jgi:formate hydrogenlyase subunit 7